MSELSEPGWETQSSDKESSHACAMLEALESYNFDGMSSKSAPCKQRGVKSRGSGLEGRRVRKIREVKIGRSWASGIVVERISVER